MAEHNHQDHSSHYRLNKNHLRQRFTQLTSGAQAPPRGSLSNPNYNLSCVFSISSQMYSSPLVPNQNHLSSKKKGLSRTLQKEREGRKKGTPFQERKMKQSQRSSKILSRVLQNCGKKKELQKTQGKWLIVKQISGSCENKQQQQKQGENIRQTDITYQGSEHKLVRYTQDHEEGPDSKQLINSWVFPASNPQISSNKIKPTKHKHKKMTLKEQWKNKPRQEISQLFAEQHQYIIHRAKIHREKINQIILSKEKKNYVQADHKELLLNHSKIHSKTFKKAGKLSKYLLQSTSSVLKIKPCNLENSKSTHLREGQLHCSLSESKINPRRNEQVRLISKYRSNRSLRKTKPTEETQSKDLTGWEYVNDFSQRQGIF